MRAGHHDQHARLADLQPPQAVNHRHLAHAESLDALSCPAPASASRPSLHRPRSPGAASGARANGCAQFRQTPPPRRPRRSWPRQQSCPHRSASRVSATAHSSALPCSPPKHSRPAALPPDTGGSSPTSSPSCRMCAAWAYSAFTPTAMPLSASFGARSGNRARRCSSNDPTVAPSGSSTSAASGPSHSFKMPKAIRVHAWLEKEYRSTA